MYNLDGRCRVFGMAARREAQAMVILLPNFATLWTPEYAATLRAVAALGASRRRELLIENDTTARLTSWPAPKAATAYSQVIH